MATVFRRPNSPFWFAHFVDQNKKSVKRSTKTTDRATAMRMAMEWEGLEHIVRHGAATVAAFQKVVDEVSMRVIGEELPNQTIRQYFTEWLKSITRKLAPSTHGRYTTSVTHFLTALGNGADQPLRTLAPRHIEYFVQVRLDQVASKTVILDVKALATALQRAENFGYIAKNPVLAVKLPKVVSLERMTFTSEEITKLIQAAPDEDWQTLILLAVYTGARLGDCLALTWDNVDYERKILAYCQQKTGKMVVAPLHVDLLLHLGRLSEKSTIGHLCRRLSTWRQAGGYGMSQSFKKIVTRAGLDLMTVQGKNGRKFARRTFHSLRHTFSSMLANAGVSEEMRMRITGHSSRDMHQRYTHVDVQSLQRAIDTLPTQPVKQIVS